MTEVENGQVDTAVLLDRGVDAIEQSAQQTRRKFLWTWVAGALLAILIAVTFLVAIHASGTANDNTHAIATSAAKTSDDTVAYLRGEQGIAGVPGENGQDGSPGLPSSEPGPAGPAGPKGDAGARGETGSAGAVGAAGTPGAPGVGSPGAEGPAGPKGATGAQGAKGATGARGPAGARGATGAVGATGPAGPPAPAPVTSIAIGQSANDTTTHKVANATCPAGRATGGGFAIVPSDPGIIPTASSPVGNTGWSVTVDQLSLPPGTAWQVLVFAVCLT